VASLLHEDPHLPLDKQETYKGWLVDLSDNLMEEITHQRRLLAAERGQYLVQRQKPYCPNCCRMSFSSMNITTACRAAFLSLKRFLIILLRQTSRSCAGLLEIWC